MIASRSSLRVECCVKTTALLTDVLAYPNSSNGPLNLGHGFMRLISTGLQEHEARTRCFMSAAAHGRPPIEFGHRQTSG
jgi:hypothetical protein